MKDVLVQKGLNKALYDKNKMLEKMFDKDCEEFEKKVISAFALPSIMTFSSTSWKLNLLQNYGPS